MAISNSYSTSTCADCGAPDASWASINRGLLLCNDCCSVHRSLGRHVSHVRSLHAPNWPPVLKETVITLVKKGSNSLWEHALGHHHSKIKVKKPSLKDPKEKQNANRQEFIMYKYKYLMFLPQSSSKDQINSVEELSKQLHASVRTNNLETCLRLISLGANPNYYHPDRGNIPLHVAAQAGQAMQVELLVVHGANPSSLDRLGHTSEECARIAGHHQLADRLIECQYELSDKLSFYLCGRTPMHSIGEHFLVPQGAGNGLESGPTEARHQLQELSNELFEELSADIYDEVDRRETDAMWLTTQQLQSSVAFLPVNPTLSPLRNQSRQKLAILNSAEFMQLLVDILLDTKRRQQLSIETGQTSGTVVPSTSDDKTAVYDPHDYDEVPMDEARSSLSPTGHKPPSPFSPKSPNPTQSVPLPPPPYNRGSSSISSVPGPSLVNDMYSTVKDVDEFKGNADYAELNDLPVRGSVTIDTEATEGGTVSRSKFNLVMEKLRSIQAENAKQVATNQTMNENLERIQLQLNKVIEENAKLRGSVSCSPPAVSPSSPSSLTPIIEPEIENEEESNFDEVAAMQLYAKVDYSKKSSRTSVGLRWSDQNQATTPPEPPNDVYSVVNKKKSSTSSEPTPVVTPPPPRQDTPLSDSAFEEASEAAASGSNPPIDVVHSQIKTLTQVIQELLKAAQSQEQTRLSPCSMKITRAVDSLRRLFPTKPASQAVQASLHEVHLSSQRLQTECQESSQTDVAYRIRQIISSAYDVAKAARHLVMCVEQDNSRLGVNQ